MGIITNEASQGAASTSESIVPNESVRALRSRVRSGEPLSDNNEKYLQSDLLLRFYLLARDQDSGTTHVRPLAEAESLLRETLTWRDSNVNGRDLHCPLCAKAPSAHSFFNIGKDHLGRVVFYGSLAKGVSQEVGLIVIHVTYALERELVRAKDGIKRWVLVLDLRGVETKHVSVTLGLKLAQIIQLRYREQLEHVYLVDASQMFDVMYSPLVPAMDPELKRRTEFMDSHDLRSVQKTLQLDSETYRWLSDVFTLPPTAALPPLPNPDAPCPVTALPIGGVAVLESDRDAWERMMARKSKRQVPLPHLEDVEQMLYDLSDDYGLPACDEDLHSAAVKLIRILSDANQEAYRRRNPQYDESSDRSLAGSMQGITGSPLLNSDMDDDEDAYHDITPRRWDEDARWGDPPEPSDDSELRTPDSPEAQVVDTAAIERLRLRSTKHEAPPPPLPPPALLLPPLLPIPVQDSTFDDHRRRLRDIEGVFTKLQGGVLGGEEGVQMTPLTHSTPHNSQLAVAKMEVRAVKAEEGAEGRGAQNGGGKAVEASAAFPVEVVITRAEPPPSSPADVRLNILTRSRSPRSRPLSEEGDRVAPLTAGLVLPLPTYMARVHDELCTTSSCCGVSSRHPVCGATWSKSETSMLNLRVMSFLYQANHPTPTSKALHALLSSGIMWSLFVLLAEVSFGSDWVNAGLVLAALVWGYSALMDLVLSLAVLMHVAALYALAQIAHDWDSDVLWIGAIVLIPGLATLQACSHALHPRHISPPPNGSPATKYLLPPLLEALSSPRVLLMSALFLLFSAFAYRPRWRHEFEALSEINATVASGRAVRRMPMGKVISAATDYTSASVQALEMTCCLNAREVFVEVEVSTGMAVTKVYFDNQAAMQGTKSLMHKMLSA